MSATMTDRRVDAVGPTTVAVVVVGVIVATLFGAAEWAPIGTLVLVACCVASARWPIAGIAAVGLAVLLQTLAATPLTGETSLARILTVALVVGVSWRAVQRHEQLRADSVAVWFGLVVVALVASYAPRIDGAEWATEVLRWGFALLVWLAARAVPMARRDRLLVAGSIAVGAGANAALALVQFATSAGPDSFQVGGLTRVFGAFGHPNELATALGLTLPLMLALVLIGGDALTGRAWLALAGVSVLGGGALLMTQSRGGWLGFAAAALVVLLFAPRRVQRAAAVGGVAVIGSIAIVGGAGPLLERITSIAMPGGDRVQVTPATWGQLERETHWGAGWAMVREHPWTGVGAGQFPERYREFTPEWRFRIPRGRAHNTTLHMAAQAGLPCAAAFIGLVGTILLAAARSVLATKTRDGALDRALAVGALGAVVAFIVQGQFEHLGGLGFPMLLAIIVAVALPSPQDLHVPRTLVPSLSGANR